MQFNPDDPRLTAYALGELDDKEREEVERLLAIHPEAREIVEEIRNAGTALAGAFAGETSPGLTGEQRAALEARLDARPPRGLVAVLRVSAVAAGLLVMTLVGIYAAIGGFASRDAVKTREVSGGKYKYVQDLDAEVAEGAHADDLAVVDAIGPDGKPVSPRRVAVREGQGIRDREIGRLMAELEQREKDLADLRRDAHLRSSNRELRFQSAEPTPAEQPYNGPGSFVPPNVQPPRAPAPWPPPESGSPTPTTPAPVASGASAAAAPVAKTPIGAFPMQLRGGAGGYFAPAGDEGSGDRRVRDSYGRLRVPYNTEAYAAIVENAFLDPRREPLSTFSIDVDTASYANVRRFLNHNTLPPRGAVRIEEFVNYFEYGYAEPIDGHPFSADVEVATCPWRTENRLVRIGLKGRTIRKEKRPASNLVFLLDVSGSMSPPNKLPLVKKAMCELTAQLDERDRVGIVTYAGTSGLALPSTPGNEKSTILGAIGQLGAGGSTNGAAGIELAYQLAVQNFVEGGINRVILCTDGDFNVGVTSHSELVSLIEDRARSGVFLSVLGFGMGNYKDDRLEKLADKGNGNYAYIDGEREARKVLVDGLAGTLITIAKDVKIQVEFNPVEIAAYRLLGYENRALANRDFNDDTKDAGEIGAGHTVTALYEVVPAGGRVPGPNVDALKYQAPVKPLSAAAQSGELLTVKIRYKQPDGQTSTKMEVPVVDHGGTYPQASRDFKFAAAVASFALLLRDSAFKGTATFDQILELGEEGKGADHQGRRAEFLELVRKAKTLKR